MRLLVPSDASVLDNVAPAVFDNAVDPRPHLAVAIINDQVVGMASARWPSAGITSSLSTSSTQDASTGARTVSLAGPGRPVTELCLP